MDKLTYLLLRQIERGATSPSFSELEQQFPRIVMRLVELWHHASCSEYLRSLLIDERGDRQGFPPEVINDLIMLDDIHWSNANRQNMTNSSFEFSFSGTPHPGASLGQSSSLARPAGQYLPKSSHELGALPVHSLQSPATR